MRPSSLETSKLQIINHFESLPQKIFRRAEIRVLLSQGRKLWRLANSTKLDGFLKFLLDQSKLELVTIRFPHRAETRYTWGKVSILELVLSLKPHSYFTHHTAMYLHHLTERLPGTLYLNSEQLPKLYRETALEQDRIDAAFRRPVRQSKNIAYYESSKICLLNGMHTGRLGVIELKGSRGEKILVTDLERTIIDITVRPVYSGGVSEVLGAYKLAFGKLSTSKLAVMLRKLDYVYPYHQAVGFYLERAGLYKGSEINMFRKFDMSHDFYLTHGMKNVVYSKDWRLYYPRRF